MNVGIVGASGYSGEVLVKLLLGHPHVTLAAVTSRQHAGKPLSAVIPALRGTKADQLTFTNSDPAGLAARADIGLWFLALPHGAAADFAKSLVPAGRKVIDLSADFRVADLATYEKYYGHHHAPELLPHARYVLPELTDPKWKQEIKLAAAPGCYPTSVLVPLLPLISAGVISRQHIVANSFSGVSGAGKKAEEAYLYCERAESAKAYGLVKHRHLSEIEEQLSQRAGAPVVIQFNPHLAPMRRGIITTITAPAAPGATIESLYAAWKQAYAGRPFVSILPSGETPDSAYVTGTNRVDLSAVHDARTGNFVITSAEDNLVKGASGQAVQIMNLWCGFPETAGLL
jgi:N-acetyl-gamma-glutamyl-phosphate reductase